MNIMTSTFVLFCIALVGAVAADCEKENEPCTRFCNKVNCPSFSCGKSKNCSQGCIERKCNDMICSAGSCEQLCIGCQSKMVCSAPNCFQSCSGNSCEMECTPEVKVCQQICEQNSICKMTCHESDKTSCERAGCDDDGANCTILPLVVKPTVEASCDDAGNCSKSCTGNCEEETITCDDKECHLKCEKGCEMKCGKTVEKCVMTCVDDSPCSRECEAKSCSYAGKFHPTSSIDPTSSAMVCQLNYFIFALFTFIMIFWL